MRLDIEESLGDSAKGSFRDISYKCQVSSLAGLIMAVISFIIRTFHLNDAIRFGFEWNTLALVDLLNTGASIYPVTPA